MDLHSASEIDDLTKDLLGRYGAVDILVNNAGETRLIHSWRCTGAVLYAMHPSDYKLFASLGISQGDWWEGYSSGRRSEWMGGDVPGQSICTYEAHPAAISSYGRERPWCDH